jgi:hypothetical protein
MKLLPEGCERGTLAPYLQLGLGPTDGGHAMAVLFFA